MTFASQYRMPGTYFDAQPAGVHPGVFRPPSSPSASSSLYLARSTGSYHSEATSALAQAKRKRRINASREATPLQEWCDGNVNLDGSADLPPTHETPQPNREARYTLAGQLETPGAAAANLPYDSGNLDDSMYSDADYRRKLGSKRPHEEMESPVSGQPTVLVQPQPVAEGWSRFAINTIGGVVGKVWEFCKAGAFRGFSAGGGKAYTIDGQGLPDAPAVPISEPEPQPQLSEKMIDFGIESPTPIVATVDTSPPVALPQSDFVPFTHEMQHTFAPEFTTPSRPAVKRRQTSAGNHDELRNWVVVDEPQGGAGRRSLPRPTSRPVSRSTRPSMTTGRRISVPKPRLSSTPAAPPRRPTTSHSTISHAGSISLSPRQPASFAGAWSPETPSQLTGPSPSRIPVPIQPAGMSPNPFARASNPNMRQSAIPSPVQSNISPHSHRRSQSSASAAATSRPKTKDFNVDSIRASPRLDAEAKKLAARRARDEHDSDARIDDFNQRLKEMIRQGREALGTKIEIDGDDGGWMDD
ncbi:uncharacterized protein CTRU02_214755 [Colletotrichum truncatum]|uniref:Uncharacterized protein n=1 Tax=Colletotrichum truncatum TaxID=5467 RepID=A0ACC3YFP2_COLTU|nr:uncharacterized protein CTRU02_09702 [Colletotrichum truncatum]KAF6788384.1 hypothetical protein CTRU02_09702 [Colletotrichum truncatum]